jgi:hypothetical protein
VMNRKTAAHSRLIAPSLGRHYGAGVKDRSSSLCQRPRKKSRGFDDNCFDPAPNASCAKRRSDKQFNPVRGPLFGLRTDCDAIRTKAAMKESSACWLWGLNDAALAKTWPLTQLSLGITGTALNARRKRSHGMANQRLPTRSGSMAAWLPCRNAREAKSRR